MRDRWLKFRLSEDEYQVIKGDAERAGVPPSSLARFRALQGSQIDELQGQVRQVAEAMDRLNSGEGAVTKVILQRGLSALLAELDTRLARTGGAP